MKSNRLLLLTFLTGIASCTLYKEYPIDIYKPGEVTLPEELADVSLISRNFRYTKDTLHDYYLSDGRWIKDKKNARLNIDSLVVSETLESLATELRKSERFDRVVVWPYETIKSHRGDKLAPYTWKGVKDLTTPTETDYLIYLLCANFRSGSLSISCQKLMLSTKNRNSENDPAYHGYECTC